MKFSYKWNIHEDKQIATDELAGGLNTRRDVMMKSYVAIVMQQYAVLKAATVHTEGANKPPNSFIKVWIKTNRK